VLNDGSGGGGAGGSVVIAGSSGLAGITVYANGGSGGNNNGGSTGPHGPGGGGGGGLIYANMALNAASSANGGMNGVTNGGISYNAQSGAGGISIQNQVIPPPLSCALLPARFLYLAASRNNNIQLDWKTGNEAGIQAYAIERSGNGIDFIPVGTMEPRPTGNGHYTFVDMSNMAAGDSYYRVKAIKINGDAWYSAIVLVKGPAGSEAFFVDPNPVNQSASLTVTVSTGGMATVRLMDISGRVAWQQPYHINQGINTLRLQALQGLHNGVYLLQYNDGRSARKLRLLVWH
jgi:hypothetical protein